MSYQTGTFHITTPQTININAIDGVQMLSLRFTTGSGTIYCPSPIAGLTASAIPITDSTPVTITGVNGNALDGVVIVVNASSTCDIITTP